MGVLNTIRRSQDDRVRPKSRSYWGIDLGITEVKSSEITEKKKFSLAEKRALQHELSGIEPVEDVIVIWNKDKNSERLSTYQVKEILSDMGFNVDEVLGGQHFADVTAVMNVNGFVVPGWVRVANFLSRLLGGSKKLLLSKLSPGKDRLHIRLFENNDGSWIVIAHTDNNWITINPVRIYKAHIEKGAGDYELGTEIMYQLLMAFREICLQKNRLFTYTKINNIVQSSYRKRLSRRIGKQVSTIPLFMP